MLNSKTFQFVVGILLLELLKLCCLCRVSVWFLFPGISDNEAAVSEMQMVGGCAGVCTNSCLFSFRIPLRSLLG